MLMISKYSSSTHSPPFLICPPHLAILDDPYVNIRPHGVGPKHGRSHEDAARATVGVHHQLAATHLAGRGGGAILEGAGNEGGGS